MLGMRSISTFPPVRDALELFFTYTLLHPNTHTSLSPFDQSNQPSGRLGREGRIVDVRIPFDDGEIARQTGLERIYESLVCFRVVETLSLHSVAVIAGRGDHEDGFILGLVQAESYFPADGRHLFGVQAYIGDLRAVSDQRPRIEGRRHRLCHGGGR